METNFGALDAFISVRPSQSEGSSSSYLSWIKSRYPAKNQSSQVSDVNADEWRRDFEVSNTLSTAVIEIKPTVALDDEEIESVDLGGLTIGLRANDAVFQAPTYTSPVKVDNFYMDGEETIQEPDLAFYMPSGMKDTAAIEPESETATVQIRNAMAACCPQPSISHPVGAGDFRPSIQHAGLANDLTVTDLDLDEDVSATVKVDSDAVDSTGAGEHPRRSAAADVVETLYFSDDENEDDDGPDAGDAGAADSEVPGGFTHEDMAAALAEFQKFSPRYKDINSTELLQAMASSTGGSVAVAVAGEPNSTGAEDGQGNDNGATRWYDDVEDFTEIL